MPRKGTVGRARHHRVLAGTRGGAGSARRAPDQPEDAETFHQVEPAVGLPRVPRAAAGGGSDSRQDTDSPEAALTGSGLERRRLAGSHHHDIEVRRRVELHQQAAACLGVGRTTDGAPAFGPPADRGPGRAAVARVPDPALGGRGIGAGAGGIDRDVADPAGDPWTVHRLAAAHHRRPDRHPPSWCSRRKGQRSVGSAPPPRSVDRRRLLGDRAVHRLVEGAAVDAGRQPLRESCPLLRPATLGRLAGVACQSPRPSPRGAPACPAGHAVWPSRRPRPGGAGATRIQPSWASCGTLGR